jgi:hypothetical protein
MQTSFNVGECVEYGWNEFKLRPAAYVLTTFVLLLLYSGAISASMYLRGIGFALSALVGPLYWICNLAVAQRGASGAEPTLNDAFRPFAERAGDHLIVALAIAAGTLLCFVGVVITWFLFMFAPLVVFAGGDFKTGLVESKDLVLKYPGEVAMIAIVSLAINLVGFLVCGVGMLVTTPITTLATVKAYEQLTRPGILTAGVKPPGEPPAPVDPMPPEVQ